MKLQNVTFAVIWCLAIQSVAWSQVPPESKEPKKPAERQKSWPEIRIEEANKNFIVKRDRQHAEFAKLPLEQLLPAPPPMPVIPAPGNEDLERAPTLQLEPTPTAAMKKIYPATIGEYFKIQKPLIDRIDYLNVKKQDGFIQALKKQRADLRGLPFRLASECRHEVLRNYAVSVFLQATLPQRIARDPAMETKGPKDLWQASFDYVKETMSPNGPEFGSEMRAAHLHQAAVSMLMQILAVESSEKRTMLAKFLATIPHVDATHALANLALYSPEEEVRHAAHEGLKLRREKDWTELVLQGFEYPHPAVAKRAAEALVALERRDLVAELVNRLEREDPRMPHKQQVNGEETWSVRELVRINHNHNCLLCHPPLGQSDVVESIQATLATLPQPNLPLPEIGDKYDVSSESHRIRFDITYLRPDFSKMMRVQDAYPWPEMQRFDFLVRTREIDAEEARNTKNVLLGQRPEQPSPYHRAVFCALRELTGLDAAPTAAAWRKLLNVR